MQTYLVPRVGTGTSHRDPFLPKYSSLLGNYQRQDYAQQPLYIVFTDLTLLEQTTLLSTALLNGGDLLAYPEDLDTQLTVVDDVLALFAAAHESRSLPADWMVSGMTYRVCARRVICIMRLAVKMKVAGESMFSIPFDQSLTQYSSAARAAFYQACTDLSLDWSAAGVVNSDTLREAIAKVLPDCDGTAISMGSWSI